MSQPQTHETPAGTGVSQSTEAGGFNANPTPASEATQPANLTAAERFLTLLDDDAETWHFRTFPEAGGAGWKKSGTLERWGTQLQLDNGNGRGVYVVVNEGGQDKDSITRVRAVFADFDPPKTKRMPASFPIEPHIVVESSPGKHHVYWLVDGLPLEEFTPIQKAIIAKFGSDPSINDLPRVMRLPGFLHRKGEPFQVRIIHESGAVPYTPDKIREAFGPVAPATPASTAPAPVHAPSGVVVDTDRHSEALALTGRMAREVAKGMLEATAWAAILAERDRGRWTRHLPDDELRRMFDGALANLRSGEWKLPATPATAPDPVTGKASVLKLQRLNTIRPGPIDWLIEDYMAKDTLAGIIGASGAGKSFVAVDMAASIATGTPWHGRPVQQGVVFYLAGEGQRGLRTRFDGWAKENGVDVDAAPIYVSAGLANLTDPGQVALAIDELAEAAAAENAEPAVIFIDTLARAMNGANENTAEDMGAFIAANDAMRMRFGCTVVHVHHTGHDKETQGRGRGSSARYAALDSEFLVTGGDSSITLTGTKEKEWTKPRPITFSKVVTEVDVIGTDGELEQVGTLALRDMVGALLDTDKKAKARELAEAGQTVRTIAVQIGVSKSTVSNWLKAA